MEQQLDVSVYAAAIQVFVQRKMRWPSELSLEAEETHLASWLECRRHEFVTGQMSQIDQARLSATIPGWRTSAEQQWLRQARKFSDFVLVEGFGNLPERAPYLGNWIASQTLLAQLNSMDVRQQVWLDDHAPGWRLCGMESRRNYSS